MSCAIPLLAPSRFFDTGFLPLLLSNGSSAGYRQVQKTNRVWKQVVDLNLAALDSNADDSLPPARVPVV